MLRGLSDDEIAVRIALVNRVMDATSSADDVVDAVSALLSATCAYIRTAPAEYRLQRAQEAADLILADVQRSFH
jgi:hypothetical protein